MAPLSTQQRRLGARLEPWTLRCGRTAIGKVPQREHNIVPTAVERQRRTAVGRYPLQQHYLRAKEEEHAKDQGTARVAEALAEHHFTIIVLASSKIKKKIKQRNLN